MCYNAAIVIFGKRRCYFETLLRFAYSFDEVLIEVFDIFEVGRRIWRGVNRLSVS